MTKIAVFNDTGNFPHVGCLAVSQAHNKMLAKVGAQVVHRYFVDQLKELWRGDPDASRVAVQNSAVHTQLQEVDAVVVNGEGTIHHGAGLHLLALLQSAQDLGKRTLLVNSVIQQCDLYHDVLRRLDDLTVRDACSSEYLSGHGIKNRIVVDSIVEADFSGEAKLDFSGKTVVTDFHHSRKDVGGALEKLLRENPDAVYCPLENPAREKDWQHFVANLRTARLVVTGRHHGVYLAALAGTPFVALPSNTWKIEGTLALFGTRIRMVEDYRQLDHACNWAVNNLSLFKEFSAYLTEQRPLSTFARIRGRRGLNFRGFLSRWCRGKK